ncbi:MAG TPA: Calx-beta domain-containing protein, partial [Anaerolineales bacterium]|nr:Calx-beta domain-containing protein [Anaerolineales bacterium]
NLALSDPVNASLGSPYTATLEIVDNDGPPTIQFGASSFDVSEGAGSATISVTLSHSFTDPVTVTYATSDDTAVAGSDYTAVSDALTFSPGDTLQTFSVPITDDSMDEPVEAISLTLTNPVNGSLGILSDAKLNIVDNDGVPTVQFGAANYSVDEDAGNALVEVTLSNMSSEPITVTYTSSNGTALAGLDYIAVNNTLTFSSGELSKTFTVPILPDSLHESDETVNLALSNPVNAGLGVPVQAVLKIKDVTEGLIVYLPLITK